MYHAVVGRETVAGKEVQQQSERISVWKKIPLHVYQWIPTGDVQ